MNGGHLRLLIGFGECPPPQNLSTIVPPSPPSSYLHLLNKLLHQILLLVACHYTFIWFALQSWIFIPYFIPGIKCCLKAVHLLLCHLSFLVSTFSLIHSSCSVKLDKESVYRMNKLRNRRKTDIIRSDQSKLQNPAALVSEEIVQLPDAPDTAREGNHFWGMIIICPGDNYTDTGASDGRLRWGEGSRWWTSQTS